MTDGLDRSGWWLNVHIFPGCLGGVLGHAAVKATCATCLTHVAF